MIAAANNKKWTINKKNYRSLLFCKCLPQKSRSHIFSCINFTRLLFTLFSASFPLHSVYVCMYVCSWCIFNCYYAFYCCRLRTCGTFVMSDDCRIKCSCLLRLPPHPPNATSIMYVCVCISRRWVELINNLSTFHLQLCSVLQQNVTQSAVFLLLLLCSLHIHIHKHIRMHYIIYAMLRTRLVSMLALILLLLFVRLLIRKTFPFPFLKSTWALIVGAVMRILLSETCCKWHSLKWHIQEVPFAVLPAHSSGCACIFFLLFYFSREIFKITLVLSRCIINVTILLWVM